MSRVATKDRFVLHAQGWLQSLRDMDVDDLTQFEVNLMADLTDLLGLDQDRTVFATCESCGAPADYDSEMILCPECEKGAVREGR